MMVIYLIGTLINDVDDSYFPKVARSSDNKYMVVWVSPENRGSYMVMNTTPPIWCEDGRGGAVFVRRGTG